MPSKRALLKLAVLAGAAATASGAITLALGRRLSRARKAAMFVTTALVLSATGAVGYKLRAQANKNGTDTDDAWKVEPAKRENEYVTSPNRVVARPRLLLTSARFALAERHMREATPEFRALDGYCKRSTERPVEGYQGETYFASVTSLTLCAKLLAKSDGKRASAYLASAKQVLLAMSDPSANPLRDSGYGIRFYGTGMALGYDWLHDLLTDPEKKRVADAIVRWVDAFEKEGFGHEHPQGNYFAGFYAAKALGALALSGDDPRGETMWSSWLTLQHGGMVAPFYARYMSSGGWPEGWRYGGFATFNMTIPSLAAESARGIDLFKSGYVFPLDQADQLMHFTWPSRDRVDDRGALSESENTSSANPHLFGFIAGVLSPRHDPRAPAFHAYAREVRAKASTHLDDQDAWRDVLFWDPWATESSYQSAPTAFVTAGMQTVSMRSDWSESAVFGTFTSGPCANYQASGEMFFDQGSLTIARGRERLLVNTTSALLEHTKGTNDGDGNSDFFYRDLFGDNESRPEERNRTVFNVFYVKGRRYGQLPVAPWRSKAKLTVKLLDGLATIVLGHGLEDAYFPREGGDKLVKGWRREIAFIRPSTFIVDDVAEAASGASDQWMAFHVARTPNLSDDRKFDVEDGSLYRGRVEFLAPAQQRIDIVDVNKRKKVFRLESHATDGKAVHRWLTVFDARALKPRGAVAHMLAAPRAKPEGDFVATQVTLEGGRTVFVVTGNAITPNVNELTYSVPAVASTHVIADLSGKYHVSVQKEADRFLVRVIQTESGAGASYSFLLDSEGRISGN